MNPKLLGLALTLVLSTAGGAWTFLLWRRRKVKKEELSRLVAKKRESRRRNLEKIGSNLKNLDGKYDKKIVELSFKELREKLQNEQLTPFEVLWAYQDRALTAHKLTNCLTEFVEEAAETAEKLMAKYAGKPKPYLYGVPFSVKECYLLQGYDTTLGLAQFVDHASTFTSPLVAKMESLGAIPFARTNLPTTMASIGSYNPIFGATRNPYDPEHRSSGGSSSGEAALLACMGSPLGLGTDIGGSVRTPAHCCGIASFKPTWGRMCQMGRRGLTPGQTNIKSCCGLMARDVDALIEVCRALWTDFDYDPWMAPIPFRETLLQPKHLKIGYYSTDGLLDPMPACRRAVQEACQALVALGHQLLEFNPCGMEEFYELYSLLIKADNGRTMKEFLDADVEDEVHDGVWFKETRFAASRADHRIKDLTHLHDLCSRLSSYKSLFVNQIKSLGLDCIVCPVLATPALTHGSMEQMFPWGWTYCALYNLLDFPAGVVPVTKVRKEDERNLEDYGQQEERAKFHDMVKIGSRDAMGMPLGVQIVGLPYQEELCLAVMKQLEDFVKFQPLNLHI